MKNIILALLFLTTLAAQGADKKISDLTTLPAADFATGDLLEIVDVSLSQSKKTRILDFDTRYTVNPMTTDGDLIYRASGVPSRLGVGSANQVLKSNGSAPTYGLITNSNVDGSAALDLTKFAAQTASRTAIFNASGFLEPSATTSAELLFVNGVTSALCGINQACTLTNKTLTSPAISTPTGIVKGDVGLGNVDNTSDATKDAATATLTNKTLTSPVLNGSLTGTGIVDDDTFGTASSTTVPTSEATKAYVDSVAGGDPDAGRIVAQGSFTSSGTFTKATYGTFSYVIVEGVGGGGAGGGASTTSAGQASCGGGGGSGGWFWKKINYADLATDETVTIGAGGNGSAGNAGGAGGTTSFGSHVSATGGGGGASGGATSGTSAGPAGQGGTVTGADIYANGNDGGYALATAGVPLRQGHGAASYYGGALRVPTPGATGNSNSTPGAGGSGTDLTASATQRTGGGGGNGIIYFTIVK